MEHEERQARQDLIRKRIRTILIETGLSQAAISDMFDIPANVICQYVNKNHSVAGQNSGDMRGIR